MSAVSNLKNEFSEELKRAGTARENILKQRQQLDQQLEHVGVQIEQLKGAIYALNEAEQREAQATAAASAEVKKADDASAEKKEA